MRKILYPILLTAICFSNSALAIVPPPPPQTVPDSGVTGVLIGAAFLGMMAIAKALKVRR